MTYLILLRGWPPNVEVLMQGQSASVPQGRVYGLPGGNLEGLDKQASDNESLPEELRWRIRRRAALREACKELGHGPNHEYSLWECVFPEIECDGKKLPREACYSSIPTRLREDFVHDVGTSVCFAQIASCPQSDNYYFLYHLDGDSVFFTTYWKPRATPEVRWKIDESVGDFGYIWQPLDRVLALPLCSWVQAFFLNYDLQDALRYLGPGSAIHNGERPYPAKAKRVTAKGKSKGNGKAYPAIRPVSSEHTSWGAWGDGSWWNGWGQDWT